MTNALHRSGDGAISGASHYGRSIPIGDLLIYLKDCRRNASPLQIFLHA
ncbi:MAG: hypothetical protein GDA38_26450 [Hormoscilla sp. SP12CHS1]|nr:hypothetical protein [Hormoscilla sp. SP12CHS1]